MKLPSAAIATDPWSGAPPVFRAAVVPRSRRPSAVSRPRSAATVNAWSWRPAYHTCRGHGRLAPASAIGSLTDTGGDLRDAGSVPFGTSRRPRPSSRAAPCSAPPPTMMRTRLPVSSNWFQPASVSTFRQRVYCCWPCSSTNTLRSISIWTVTCQ